MRYFALAGMLLLLTFSLKAQQLSLEQCFTALEQNDPLTRQKAVKGRLTGLREANIRADNLPQISLNAQGSYQSDVTSLPVELPGVEIPTLSQDQYRITADVNYALYDGGLSKTRLALEALAFASQNLQLDAALLQQQQQVLETYTRAMLFEKNTEILETQKEVLEARQQKVLALVTEGVAMRNQATLIETELMRLEQEIETARASRSQQLQSLRHLTKLEFSDAVRLADLDSPALPSADFNGRPEMQLMEKQRAGLRLQNDMEDGMSRPKVALFGQGGYGRPGLNLLDNAFAPWYIGGIRLSWNLGSLYSLKRKKEANSLSKEIVDLKEETTRTQLQNVYDRQLSEVQRLQGMVTSDLKIIELAGSVPKAYAAQLDEGIITSDTYITQLKQENQARLLRALHETQLLLSLHTLSLLTSK
jgi:outer membrane protein TolC